FRRSAIPSLFGLFVSTATADVVRHGSFPEAYWGTWVGTSKTATDSRVIVLSAKSYLSSEASCSVDWVSQTASARGSVYSAHVRCTDRVSKENGNTAGIIIVRPNSVDRIEVGSEYATLKPYRRCSSPCPAIRHGNPSED